MQVARVRVPKAWRDLMEKRVPRGAPVGPPRDLEDPSPRREDFRSIRVPFPDGAWATFLLTSSYEGGRYGCAADMYPAHPSEDLDPFHATLPYERTIPDRVIGKHGGKTYVLELE